MITAGDNRAWYSTLKLFYYNPTIHSSLWKKSIDKEFSLYVIIDVLMEFFYLTDSWKESFNSSACCGQSDVKRACRRQVFFGNISLGYASSTYARDGKDLSAVTIVFSCCANTWCSASFKAMEMWCWWALLKVLGKQGAAGLILIRVRPKTSVHFHDLPLVYHSI